MDKQIESNLNFILTVAGMVAIATDGTGILDFYRQKTPSGDYGLCVQMNARTWHKYFGEKATHAETHDGATTLWVQHNGYWFLCVEWEEAEA